VSDPRYGICKVCSEGTRRWYWRGICAETGGVLWTLNRDQAARFDRGIDALHFREACYRTGTGQSSQYHVVDLSTGLPIGAARQESAA
jgi:hypothetical protein